MSKELKMTCNMQTQVQIVRAALFTPAGRGRWGLPLMLWGEPGIAKTAVLEEISMSYVDMPTETLSPGERGEGAFGVVPVPGYSTAALTNWLERLAQLENLPPEVREAMLRMAPPDMLNYPRPDWTGAYDTTQRGVVFIDEIPNAPPAIQPPLYGLVLNGTIGSHRLPPGVRRIGAGNPPEKCGIGYPMPPALANRVGHINWSGPSVSDHIDYMMRGDLDEAEGGTLSAEQEEKRVLASWTEAFARARGLETAYLRRRPTQKNQFPEDLSKASRAWPSDRSWTNATRALASSFVHHLSDAAREEFVAAFIGEAIAGEWFEWMDKEDLPDPAAILDGKEKFKHQSKRLDRTVAVLNGCVALVVPTSAPERKARGAAMWALLESVMADKCDKDVLVPPVRALCNARLNNEHKAAAEPVLEPLYEIVMATKHLNHGDEL